MPHYLNTPWANGQLDMSIRRFQGVIEALAVSRLNQEQVAQRLGTTVADLDQMRRTADRAGVTAIFGFLGPSENVGRPAATLHFHPNDERLSELFLVHKVLREMQAHYPNRGRFRLRFLPLLALTKAIGRDVFRKGHGPRYRRAARKASALLRAGEIVLPCLED